MLDLRFRILAPEAPEGWSVDDWIEWVSERAAVLEFDGELDREAADQQAFLLWRLYRARAQ